ncbi:hypothetical protein T4C_512, partial [Trichinella pseudospiralis]
LVFKLYCDSGQDKLDFNEMINSVKIVIRLLFSHFTPITRWIDLSDPRRSIGQEGQSTDLCLQANPHTISVIKTGETNSRRIQTPTALCNPAADTHMSLLLLRKSRFH